MATAIFPIAYSIKRSQPIIQARNSPIVSGSIDLVGLPREDLVGRVAIELTATPEDQYFWEDVANSPKEA